MVPDEFSINPLYLNNNPELSVTMGLDSRIIRITYE